MPLVCGDGEGGISGGGDGGGIHIRALVQEDAAHLGVAATGRFHEGSEAGLGPVLHIGLAIQQQGDHLVPTLSSCEKLYYRPTQ